MKRNIFLLLLSVFILISCNDQLNTTDLLNKNDSNFPNTEEDLNASLAAVYICIGNELSTFHYSNILSDDMFAGGGVDEVRWMDQMKKNAENLWEGTWSANYTGIFRANKIIENIDLVTNFASPDSKNQLLGEAYFMRAFFNFELVRIFGDVPLLNSSALVNIPRTPAKEVYAQIATDLKKAIEIMPSTSIKAIPAEKLGHATKWAAEGLLARVYLFYTGYYKANDMPLAGGGSLTKDQVVTYLNDCIDNSGHQLASDFRNLWPYTNALTVVDYKYTKGKGLHWLGEEGSNMETVFAKKFRGPNADWSNFEVQNELSICYSLRGQTDYADVFPFSGGWGMGTVNPKWVQQWQTEEPNDSIRRWGSIADLKNPREGIKMYEEGGWEQQDETHLWNKKYSTWNAWKVKGKTFAEYSAGLYGLPDNGIYLMATQDLVLLRFADVLLMHSELSQTNTGLNRVRARAGIGQIAYSLDALKKERQHELAFEGVRYYDLLRWYGTDAGSIIDASQNGVVVMNNKVNVTIQYNVSERVKATGGFFELPNSQILRSGNVLIQNPGWGPEANYSSN